MTELHGFCDASESAYAAVVYFRTHYSERSCHISLITGKTKVAPIKRLTIQRLELCGAVLLIRIIHHLRTLLNIPLSNVYTWTDSTVVLGWIRGNPRHFKTFVGNRVSEIIEYLPPGQWRHVNSADNPADCGSRGLQPSELLAHDLWWNGPQWLAKKEHWPTQGHHMPTEDTGEERTICHASAIHNLNPIVPIDCYSSFTRLKLVTAWMLRFLHNIHLKRADCSKRILTPYLSVDEITSAEFHFINVFQNQHFHCEIKNLHMEHPIEKSSPLTPLNPFFDPSGLLRVGGRQNSSIKPYDTIHPLILHGQHLLTKLIIKGEHLRLLHGGPSLVNASLSTRVHIIGKRRIIRDITRQCVRCKIVAAKPQVQKMGNLPRERVTPDRPFANVGIGYAGPFYVKYGYVRKPTIVKAYAGIFVSLSVKAIHIELVTDLTTGHRFVARRGKPSLIMSENGTNFVGANRELCQLSEFLKSQQDENEISQYCSAENIQWRIIPECAPHFGGIWEAAVKSVKYHLRRVIGDHKLTFEELYMVRWKHV